MSARPARPLPSTNGWIVSNCACAIAAWTAGGRASSLQNAHRSSSRVGDEPGDVTATEILHAVVKDPRSLPNR
jgi:hypothetical protein